MRGLIVIYDMSALGDLNLIHFLDFYFAFYFFAGTLRRIGQYQSIAGLVFTVPGRWPRAAMPRRRTCGPPSGRPPER